MIAAAFRRLLSRIDYFSAGVLRMRLRGYQLRPLQAVLESVLHRRGYEFLLIFPRQAGKNEAIAHLLVYLLNLLQRVGGNVVFAAMADQVGRGALRLEERRENSWNRGKWRRGAEPTRRVLGRAAGVFVSSHPAAKSRGETAHWLLVVDELQDQVAGHLEAVFTPMRAANNATALYVGTVRVRSDALWQKRLELERLEREDGVRRVWVVGPEEVVRENRAYGTFLAGQVAKYGREHPIVRSEYFLEPMDGEGGLFPPRRRALMRGRHARLRGPAGGLVVAGLIDVGGQDEGATDPVAQLEHPGRDYTVCTIVGVEFDGMEYGFRALDVFVDQGSKHFEDFEGRPALARRLLAFLEMWGVGHVVCDGTGVGEGLGNWLAARLGRGRVTGFKFTPGSKAKLGSDFVSLVETGRFEYWTGDEEEVLSDGWWFWQQVEHCGYEMPPGGQFERDLRWGVAETAVVNPLGEEKGLKVHDDRLVSGALAAVLDGLLREGKVVMGRAESAVIEGVDPLEDVGF